jgi:uncharacterized glyoxalase superfamily protein PhnB
MGFGETARRFGMRTLISQSGWKRSKSHVGNQTGGRVSLFLYTDDFWGDYHEMQNKGIRFVREPKQEAYGTVAVFSDLYGNLWDLLQPKL